jgi:hypothetical protein
MNDKFVDIFAMPLSKDNNVKLWDMLGLQEIAIMGGCIELISPPKYSKCCANCGGGGGWLKQ